VRRLQNKRALRAGCEWVAAPCLFKVSLACLPKITRVAAASQHARLSRNEMAAMNQKQRGPAPSLRTDADRRIYRHAQQ
jgi:hypothetical protein